jgi:nitrogenase molybdenum-iron protein alpha chain
VKFIKNVRLIVTNLDERDIVHGGEQKLKDSILLAYERYTPKLIFIFTSCASGIIGDDVDSIAAEVQKQISSIIVPIHCEGFKSKIAASGFDSAFISISQ